MVVERHPILTQSGSKRDMHKAFKETTFYQAYQISNTRRVLRTHGSKKVSISTVPSLCYSTFVRGICGCVTKQKRRTCVKGSSRNQHLQVHIRGGPLVKCSSDQEQANNLGLEEEASCQIG